MTSRWDTLDTPEGSMRCYVAGPDEAQGHPAVIVIQHAGGVDDFIQAMSDRLGDAGFVVIAPDLYHREEPDSKDDPMTRMSRLRDANIVTDVNAAAAHARTLPEVNGERIGITGFCMGGRVAYLMAARNSAFKAAVVFYGGNIMVPWGEGPTPLDLTADIGCPVLGLFGDDDPNPTPADVAKIGTEMTRLGKTHEFHGYPGAGHAFMNEPRPSFRPAAAADAWKRCVEWFTRHLGA